MSLAFSKRWPLYLSTKNTIFKKYDSRRCMNYEERWKKKFEEHSYGLFSF
ncbi:hypothetical protein AAHE18_19G154000 [Arachis hypogaea]